MRRALFALTLTLLICGRGAGLRVRPAVAAGGVEPLPFQVCARDGKVNVLVGWRNADPGAREFWIDLSKVGTDFAAGTYVSAGPIAGSATTYNWNGLEPHTVHWIRINQQLPDGSWDYGPALRLVTACGMTAPSPDATFSVIGFADHHVDFAPPDDVTPAGGTLSACKSPIIYIFFQVSGLTDLTDFIGQWTRAGAVQPEFAWGFPPGDNKPLFSIRPLGAGGFVPGPYTFKLSSGPANNRKTNLEASFTLAC